MIVNSTWGKAFKIRVEGTSDFAKLHNENLFPVKFKINSSKACSHWEITVNKTLTSNTSQSSVTWGSRKMDLYSDNIELERKSSGKRQYVIAHEVGHGFGNLKDEYKILTRILFDRSSMMNHGMIRRRRHLDHILSEFNGLIPNTNFYL